MNIQVKDLLDIIGYNGTISPLALSKEIAEEIEKEDKNTLCFVEHRHPEIYDVWYPIDTWYAECQRRNGMADKLAELKRQVKPDPKDLILKKLMDPNTPYEEKVKLATQL